MDSSSESGATEPYFRPVDVDDLTAIAALESQEFSSQPYPYFVLRQLFEVHGSHWMVAEIERKVCGYALIAVGQEGSAWVIGLAVAGSHRGLGLGKELLVRAVDRCRGARIDTLFITVRPSNTPAVNLYKKSGFVWVDHDEHYFGPEEPRDLLAHRLDDPGGYWWDAGPQDRRWSKGDGPQG
ncbi:GNAT family N-acetyltransferase [Nocardia sp. FBN12]|uniref:GNAT family N-acetyltransferase n=1 Tax=Nocardia sp. FBN12 TaxID=3419766 RepID=UPI003D0298CC